MTDDELPEFIDRSTLRYPPEVIVGDEAIVRCFVNSNKPFLSRSDVEEMSDLGSEGARQRLDSLESRGILMSSLAGRQTKIYWLNHPESRWPVPDDLPQREGDAADVITKINSLTTPVLFITGVIGSMFVFQWASALSIFDGVFTMTINPELMTYLAATLFLTLFYVTLQTSLFVENDGAGWPTIRRLYRRITA